MEQSFEHFEIMVVDDGSEDNTRETIELINDRRVKYVNYGRLGNISLLRNIGIKSAEGEYIAFCDDDDVWERDKLKKQFTFFHSYDMVCSNAEVINLERISVGEVFHKDVKTDFIVTYKELLKKNYVITSSVVLRKDILSSGFTFDDKNMKSTTEDYDLWLILLLNKDVRIYFVNESLVRYRVHENLTYTKENFPLVYINSVNAVTKYTHHANNDVKQYACMGVYIFEYRLLRLYIHYKQLWNVLKTFAGMIYRLRKNSFRRAAWQLFRTKI